MQQWALAISENVWPPREYRCPNTTSRDWAEVRDGNDDRRSSSRPPLVTNLIDFPPLPRRPSLGCAWERMFTPAGYVRRRGAGLLIAIRGCDGGVLGLIESRRSP
jgi:hypothetical protein